MDRSSYIEGLNVGALMPADIEVFIASLARRVPRRVRPESQATLDHLIGRLAQLASDMDVPGTMSNDIEEAVHSIIAQVRQVKRRQWKSKSQGERLLDTVRGHVAEISADLHTLTH
jgi:hypothetical protein